VLICLSNNGLRFVFLYLELFSLIRYVLMIVNKNIYFRCVTNNSSSNPFLYYGAAGSQVISFVLAIVFLIIYYKYCHPSLSKRSEYPSGVNASYIENDKPCYSKTSYNFRTSS